MRAAGSRLVVVEVLCGVRQGHHAGLIVEDSNHSLRAALAAKMRYTVTTSLYTADDDFSSTEKVVPDLSDRRTYNVKLADFL